MRLEMALVGPVERDGEARARLHREPQVCTLRLCTAGTRRYKGAECAAALVGELQCSVTPHLGIAGPVVHFEIERRSPFWIVTHFTDLELDLRTGHRSHVGDGECVEHSGLHVEVECWSGIGGPHKRRHGQGDGNPHRGAPDEACATSRASERCPRWFRCNHSHPLDTARGAHLTYDAVRLQLARPPWPRAPVGLRTRRILKPKPPPPERPASLSRSTSIDLVRTGCEARGIPDADNPVSFGKCGFDSHLRHNP